MPSTTGKNGSQPLAQYLLVYGVPSKQNYPFLTHALKAEQAHSVLVPEMRPQLWGARFVARELLARKTPTTLISDNMMGTLFAQGEILKLCLFYDGLSERDLAAFVARCSRFAWRGTMRYRSSYSLRKHPRVRGADRDVSTFLGQRICPAGVSVHPIESEILPWEIFKNASGASS